MTIEYPKTETDKKAVRWGIFFTITFSFFFSIYSEVILPSPKKFNLFIYDFMIKFIILFFLFTIINYLIIIRIKLKRSINTGFVALVVGIFLSLSGIYTVGYPRLMDMDKIPFEEGVKGILYIGDNITGYQRCLMAYVADKDRVENWRTNSVNFVLNFNKSKYQNCSIKIINIKDNLKLEIPDNITNYLNVNWSEDNMCVYFNNNYYNRYVEFEVFWDSNHAIAYPELNQVLVDHFITNLKTNVSVGYDTYYPEMDSRVWFEDDIPRVKKMKN